MLFFRYLIFFDDGYAQYVDYNNVLLVYEYSKEVWCDVHPDSSDFIKSYIIKYPERPMVRMSLGQVVTTEWNGASLLYFIFQYKNFIQPVLYDC